MTVLVDSWAWVEYFRGSEAGRRAREVIEGSEEVAIVSAINVAEVFHWVLRFYDERTAEEKREAMKQRAFVCDVGEEVAVDAAKLRLRKGLGLGGAIVYATAKREKAEILTGDPDFNGLDGVIFMG
ncbi:MAG: type II toxin-antitoxin system VapC family toxin [Candidatus Hodarchaeaceae archaeon]|nr:type II toxin-antitoxin system VapC family toxin [Candidatus Hodarchaeaceae archaeon]